MKTILLSGVAGVVMAALLPSLPARIILSVFVFLAALTEAIRRKII